VKRSFKFFVLEFARIYGPQHIVFNVHNLIHLADDCIYFNSSLNKISAFLFENYLGKLKRMLRGTMRPLAQLFKRILELENQASVVTFQQPNPYCNQSIRSIVTSF